MIIGQLEAQVERRLLQSPAVALLGPRQVGKTTLAGAIAARHADAQFRHAKVRHAKVRHRDQVL